ncbi:MAG: methylamine---glutamate N-methyltransferase subunit [Solirubrobacterales bacterium]|jgi:amidophosphoribosyltransferase|nr:methylamine---glutamate N-methyltransferase subunit [Solirubrobacterales bacterium]
MCGIVGIFSKSSETSEQLGAHLARMLVEMADRGPDSAGIAVYRDPLPAGSCKISLHATEGDVDWAQVETALSDGFTVEEQRVPSPGHALLTVTGDAAEVHARVEERLPGLRVMSAGRAIEIYKEAVAPADFVEQFEIGSLYGSHALGHTRMATESRVSTDGSHPFSTGLDLCLVHNGSLSNHNRLRRSLRREGIPIQTQNDSEVAAGYLTWRMREGDTLDQALERSLEDLDGFFTFAVGTADGFAVLRDPIACKPAVIAETDAWVAIASEYRALAVLPGAEEAEVWEPEPGRVYSWAHEVVA